MTYSSQLSLLGPLTVHIYIHFWGVIVVFLFIIFNKTNLFIHNIFSLYGNKTTNRWPHAFELSQDVTLHNWFSIFYCYHHEQQNYYYTQFMGELLESSISHMLSLRWRTLFRYFLLGRWIVVVEVLLTHNKKLPKYLGKIESRLNGSTPKRIKVFPLVMYSHLAPLYSNVWIKMNVWLSKHTTYTVDY